MYDDLKGKTVVVTGSSKGLGAAMARRFGAEGMNVVANYRSDEEGARETVRAIEEAGGAAAAVQADVSKTSAWTPCSTLRCSRSAAWTSG